MRTEWERPQRGAPYVGPDPLHRGGDGRELEERGLGGPLGPPVGWGQEGGDEGPGDVWQPYIYRRLGCSVPDASA
jgi:hypothetical protein